MNSAQENLGVERISGPSELLASTSKSGRTDGLNSLRTEGKHKHHSDEHVAPGKCIQAHKRFWDSSYIQYVWIYYVLGIFRNHDISRYFLIKD